MKKLLLLATLTPLLLWPILSSANKQSPYYAGVGFSLNIPENDNQFKTSLGYQLFGGYQFENKIADVISLSVEAGYHNTGDFDGKAYISNGTIIIEDGFNSAGVWVAGVFGYEVFDSISINGKLGADLGDDDGALFGVGLGYQVFDEIKVNVDYINRSNSQAGQFNIIYQF